MVSSIVKYFQEVWSLIFSCWVASLVNQQLSPGTYDETWDASNIASGVYFYRINAGNYNAVKKMVLIK